jgi:hypothetical protein
VIAATLEIDESRVTADAASATDLGVVSYLRTSDNAAASAARRHAGAAEDRGPKRSLHLARLFVTLYGAALLFEDRGDPAL